MGAWKLSKRALRRQQLAQAKVENKPAGKPTVPPVVGDLDKSKVVPRDFPAGNVADIKRTSLFLHNDHGKATAQWWANAKGIPV